jgi:hypothetical protein
MKMPQTSEIHQSTQHFNVIWHCATYFSLHKPSSGTFLLQQFKQHEYILTCSCAVHDMILPVL